MDDLERAARAHREAGDALDSARQHLHDAIRAALADGRSQASIARITGYTRERIRQITLQRQ